MEFLHGKRGRGPLWPTLGSATLTNSPERNRTLSRHPWSASQSCQGHRRRGQLQVSLLQKTASSPVSCPPGARRIQALIGRQRHWRGALPLQVVGFLALLCFRCVPPLPLYFPAPFMQPWTEASYLGIDPRLLTILSWYGMSTIHETADYSIRTSWLFLRKKSVSALVCLAGLMVWYRKAKYKSTGRTLIYFRLFHILQFKGKIKEILFSLMLDADDGSKSFHQIGGLFMCLASLQLTLNLNIFEQVRAGLI